MDKPIVLYHGSPKRDIVEFEPRDEHVRDINEGSVVFATPFKDYAACFIVTTDDSWAQISGFNSVRAIIVSDEKRYKSGDRGGVIYELPIENFIHETRGGAKDEWTSRVPVKPIGKTIYDSGLDSMLEHGVQVYFVDAGTFKNIRKAKDHGIGILHTLTSENQRRNLNVVQLPKGDFSE